MIQRTISISAIILLLGLYSYAQPSRAHFKGEVTGRVVDFTFDTPLSYASIILFSQGDSSQVTGITTDDQGYFQLKDVPAGQYYAEISFMGFQKKILPNIRLNFRQPAVELGTIKLKQTYLQGEDVEVEVEKQPIEFKIDKKVINVDKQYTAISGTAVDVLKNVPSVTTDIEGNVMLRGSSNFNLLIDGRPSPLDPADALEQIPASTIDNIEIITNPSARYNPEGTAGIINIILKRSRTPGQSGIVNSNIGYNDKYSGDFLLSNKQGLATINFGGNYNYRSMPGTSKEEKYIYSSQTSLSSKETSHRFFNPYGLRMDVLFDLSLFDRLGFNASISRGRMNMEEDTDYSQSVTGDPAIDYYSSVSEMHRQGRHYTLGADFRHKFGPRDHEFNAVISHFNRKMKGENSSQLYDFNGQLTSGQESFENGPGSRTEIQLGYIRPIGDAQKIEIGAQSRLANSQEETGFSQYDTLTGNYIADSLYAHTIDYKNNIHALYAMFSREIGKFGFQFGFRTEYTDRYIELKDSGQDFRFNRWDYYPSAHFSYDYGRGIQFMSSYSRRVEPIRPWHLEPFPTWTDAYSIRQGNPSLKPEIIDSYEIGLQKTIERGFISVDLYHRTTHDLIEHTQTAYSELVTLFSVENVGQSYASGVETTVNKRLSKWWDLNLIGTAFDYRIFGDLYGESIDEKSFNWNLRFNNSFTLAKSTKIQWNSSYTSPSVTAQGEIKGFFLTDIALRQEFWDKKLSATLQVSDIFSTGKRELSSENTGMYLHSTRRREAPTYMLNISLNINNYRPEKKKERPNSNGDMEEEY